MAVSKFQLGAISALAIGGFAIALILQSQALERARDKNGSLQQQIQELSQDLSGVKAQFAKAQVDQDELERLRRGQSELLRLRGEVTALREASKLAARQSAPPATGSSIPPEATPGVTRLQASVRAQVGSGETLLTGGWTSKPGNRIFILATPVVQGDDADQVEVTAKVIQVADAALAKVGLDASAVEGRESSLKQVLPADKAKQLVDLLREADGVDLLAQPRVTTSDGEQAQVQIDPEASGTATHSGWLAITVVPVILGDKTTIDFSFQARINQSTPKAR
jgi:hypothetical protein